LRAPARSSRQVIERACGQVLVGEVVRNLALVGGQAGVILLQQFEEPGKVVPGFRSEAELGVDPLAQLDVANSFAYVGISTGASAAANITSALLLIQPNYMGDNQPEYTT
jgi:hypothetical protein